MQPVVDRAIIPAPGMLERPFAVAPEQAGQRLDRFLGGCLPRLSRSRVQAVILGGRVRLRGQVRPVTRVAARVQAGQVYIVDRPALVEPPAVLSYEVLHEDADLLVLDKPAGLPVHPSARWHRHTLTAVLRDRLGPQHGWELAHRLDRETSGVLVLGRAGRGASAARMKRAFCERRVDKSYLALCRGRFDGLQKVEIPLGSARGSRIRIKMGARTPAEGGLSASTILQSVCYGHFRGEPCTLVRAWPRTGRQHQIRVHLALLGHPVLGDKLYGVEEALFLEVFERGASVGLLEHVLGLPRQALHAESIALPHPRTDTMQTFHAPWPSDLARIVALPGADPGTPLPPWSMADADTAGMQHHDDGEQAYPTDAHLHRLCAGTGWAVASDGGVGHSQTAGARPRRGPAHDRDE